LKVALILSRYNLILTEYTLPVSTVLQKFIRKENGNPFLHILRAKLSQSNASQSILGFQALNTEQQFFKNLTMIEHVTPYLLVPTSGSQRRIASSVKVRKVLLNACD